MLKKVLENNKYRNNVYHEENQYLNLINDIIENNETFEGRNGKTLAVFGSAMHFSLENNKIPLLTTKKLAIKTCLKELLWFIKGDTNNKNLKNENVHIWNANSSRSFLDNRGLTDYEEDDCGPIYGFQWRHFNAPYKDCNSDYSGCGIDQLNYIISHGGVKVSQPIVTPGVHQVSRADVLDNTIIAQPPGQMPAQNNISMIDALPNMQQNGVQQNNGLSSFQTQAIENSFMESMEPMAANGALGGAFGSAF